MSKAITNVYMSNNTSPVTGDGTTYQVVFDTVAVDATSNYDTTYGTLYCISCRLLLY